MKKKKLWKRLLKESEAQVARLHSEALFWREMFEKERHLTETLLGSKFPKDSYKQGPIRKILDRMQEKEDGRADTPSEEPPRAE